MNPPTIDYTVTSAVDYFPYGAALRSYGKSRYLTTQHERDLETGFDYRGARFYDSEVGRFLSVDPLAAKYPSMSSYNYVAGNPLMFVDPTGKYIIEADSNHDGVVTKKEKRQAKTLRKSIRALRKYVRKLDKNSVEMKGILGYGEFKSKKALIKHVLRNGNGPRIRFGAFRQQREGFSMMNPQDGKMGGKSQYGNFRTGGDLSSGITLDIGIEKALSQSKNSTHSNTVKSGGTKAAGKQAFGFFKAVVLHETIHYGDEVTNNASIKNHNPSGGTQPSY